MKIPIIVPSSANAQNNSLTLKSAIALIVVMMLNASGIVTDLGEVTELVNTTIGIISAVAFVVGGVRRIIARYK